jgi:hypothetical protein
MEVGLKSPSHSTAQDAIIAAETMNKYTFIWTISPSATVEYADTIPPFDVVIGKNTITLTTKTSSAHAQLIDQANEVAHAVARSLSYEHRSRFDVAYGGYEAEDPTGSKSKSGYAIVGRLPAISITIGTVEVRDSDGNVIDSSAIRRQKRLTTLTRRAILDPNLRDMLDHWSRYASDPDGRLHPLYDVLQVVERKYGRAKAAKPRKIPKTREQAAKALKMKPADLDELGKISNDPNLLNGRHPGQSPGPHRTASGAEVNTCERVARAIIDNYAAKIAI